MSVIPTALVTRAAADLLIEAYAGPPDPRSTWFIDNELNSGILGLLDGVTAEEAYRRIGTGEGTSIAANAEHLRWSLANVNRTLRGEEWNPNWSESWNPVEAGAGEWNRLRQGLRAEFEMLSEAIPQQIELPHEYLLGLLALTPHAAFHLGLMRQLVERVRTEI